jgi:Zn-dependent metalloprotease
MSGYVQTMSDNGGVHTNSGIPNKAFAELSLALGGPAWEKAGRIWYETLRDSQVHADATFRQFAERTQATARSLFGAGSGEANAVDACWSGVGVL